MLQVFCVNALLNHLNVLCVTPTGSGKSAVMYVFALCVKKLNPRGLIVVGMPLSMLIAEQHKNSWGLPVLTLTMGAKIKGTVVEAQGEPKLAGQDSGDAAPQDLTLEEACTGKYGLLFGHPEAFAGEPGQKILRKLSKEMMISAVMVDEVHQGEPKHFKY